MVGERKRNAAWTPLEPGTQDFIARDGAGEARSIVQTENQGSNLAL